MAVSTQVDNGPGAEKRRKALRAANRLIVGAGIILAESGIPRHAPEMKALSAALRAVNRAGVGPWSQAVPPVEKEAIPAHTHSEAQRFRRAAP